MRATIGDLTVALPEGMVETQEMILEVAVKDSSLLFDDYTQHGMTELPLFEGALMRINCWILDIPRDLRTIDMINFHIVK